MKFTLFQKVIEKRIFFKWKELLKSFSLRNSLLYLKKKKTNLIPTLYKTNKRD